VVFHLQLALEASDAEIYSTVRGVVRARYLVTKQQLFVSLRVVRHTHYGQQLFHRADTQLEMFELCLKNVQNMSDHALEINTALSHHLT
jgi:hypothetical protein